MRRAGRVAGRSHTLVWLAVQQLLQLLQQWPRAACRLGWRHRFALVRPQQQSCLPPHNPPSSVLPPGPKEKLDLTAVSQPAIYVASLAALEKLKAEQVGGLWQGGSRLR